MQITGFRPIIIIIIIIYDEFIKLGGLLFCCTGYNAQGVIYYARSYTQ